MLNGLNVGIIVVLLGLYGVLTRRNLIKLVMSLYIMNSGIILFFVSLGYVTGGQAAIFEDGNKLMVDPLPQAVMLTAIVIGLVITSKAGPSVTAEAKVSEVTVTGSVDPIGSFKESRDIGFPKSEISNIQGQ